MPTISRDYAIELWKKRYGDKKYIKDCFGVWVYIDDYNDLDTRRSRLDNGKLFNYSWSIDHIFPKSKGGKDNDNNLEIMHSKINMIKSDNLVFEVNGQTYYVKKVEGKAYYAIFNSQGTKVSEN